MTKDMLKEEKTAIINNEEVKYAHKEAYFILFIKIAVPLVMLMSGLALLALRLAGWSLIFGLPVTIIGVILLVYGYDDILSKKYVHNHEHIIEQEE